MENGVINFTRLLWCTPSNKTFFKGIIEVTVWIKQTKSLMVKLYTWSQIFYIRFKIIFIYIL